MPVTNYYTVNGEIIGEQTTGQERIDYLTDPLGNVTATIDQNAKVLNRYTYKPFGEVLSKEGTAPDPKFLWVGAHGYRQTGKKYADVYIRRRTYDTSGGRWTSKDPAGYIDGLSRYLYASMNPITFLDASGFQSSGSGREECRILCKDCREACKTGGSPALAEYCYQCWQMCQMEPPAMWNNPKDPPKCKDGETPVFITCYGSGKRRGECAVYCPIEWCKKHNKPHPPGQDYPGSDRPLCDVRAKVRLTIPGVGTCQVSNGGCGQQRRYKPVPDNWIDFPDCKFGKGWVCIELPPACNPNVRHPSPRC